MHAKTMLTFVDPAEGGRPDEEAYRLAEVYDLHLRIVVVGLNPDGPASYYRAETMRGWAERNDRARNRAEAMAEEIEQELQRRGISGDVVHHLVDERDLAGLAGIHGRYADLPMIFRPVDPGIWHRNLVSGLIFQSGRPLLLVPQHRKPVMDPKHVVVAWNGRVEAVRALYAALAMLEAAERVAIVMIDPSFTEWGDGQEPGFDIAGTLARHDIPTEVFRLDSRGREPGRLLLAMAGESKTDMIVMGAYGHSRMREWILGGTTRHMLAEADVPIFLMH